MLPPVPLLALLRGQPRPFTRPGTHSTIGRREPVSAEELMRQHFRHSIATLKNEIKNGTQNRVAKVEHIQFGRSTTLSQGLRTPKRPNFLSEKP